MTLSEEQVKNAVIIKLGEMGYKPTSIKTLGEHGVDIRAKHGQYSRYFLIEVKGDPPKEARHANSGREVRFMQSVGQIVTRICPRRGYYYGLAYPSSYKQMVIRRLHPDLLKRLQIHLFFVDSPKGKPVVEHLTWKEVAEEWQGVGVTP